MSYDTITWTLLIWSCGQYAPKITSLSLNILNRYMSSVVDNFWGKLALKSLCNIWAPNEVGCESWLMQAVTVLQLHGYSVKPLKLWNQKLILYLKFMCNEVISRYNLIPRLSNGLESEDLTLFPFYED